MKREILKQHVYHDGTSMIVLAAGDMHQAPARLLQSWIDRGIVAGKTSKQLAHEAAASADDAKTDETVSAFEMTHVGGGYYAISGPGLDEPERVKGKTEAQVRVAELDAAHEAAAAAGGEGGDGEGGAPTE
jgi:hypothetical protein